MTLTENDLSVLDTIFNPLGLNIVETQNVDKFSKDPEVISDREFEAMQLAEQGQLDKAIELQTHLIENHSGNCASLYNNRAQMHVLQNNLDIALEDLNKAISISNSAETKGKRDILSKAYCARAMIQTRISKANLNGGEMFDIPEAAMEDFEKAAALGNEFAKKELVRLNPYSRMCNAMLSQLIFKQRS